MVCTDLTPTGSPIATDWSVIHIRFLKREHCCKNCSVVYCLLYRFVLSPQLHFGRSATLSRSTRFISCLVTAVPSPQRCCHVLSPCHVQPVLSTRCCQAVLSQQQRYRRVSAVLLPCRVHPFYRPSGAVAFLPLYHPVDSQPFYRPAGAFIFQQLSISAGVVLFQL